MSDNLTLLKDRINTDIDPNGLPESILAQNHNDILQDVLNKVGKYTGSYFQAKKNETDFTAGKFSWEGNAMNNTSNFNIKVSKNTSDLNDFGLFLNQLNQGDFIRFKDFEGRSVVLEFNSYIESTDGSANNNDIYIINVKGKAENINYTYQDEEVKTCCLEFFQFQGQSSGSGEKSYVNTIFIDNVNGNDLDGEIENISKPFLTIDAAFTAIESQKPRTGSLTDYEHDFINVVFISAGNHPLNGIIPQRNLNFISTEFLTIDFSANGNSLLNGTFVGSKFQYNFDIPNGRIYNTNNTRMVVGMITGKLNIIESIGTSYTGFNISFIEADTFYIEFKFVKGQGNIFKTTLNTSTSFFKGNIDGQGNICLVNKGFGTVYIDFDTAISTERITLIDTSDSAARCFINHGILNAGTINATIVKCRKARICFKKGATTNGYYDGFSDEIFLTGSDVTVNSNMSRLNSKMYIDGLKLKCNNSNLVSLLNANGQLIISNSVLEIDSELIYIETNLTLTNPLLVIDSFVTVKTNVDNSDLVTKASTANVSGINYLIRYTNTLKTNALLNTTVTGVSNDTATISNGTTTNTY